MTLVEFVPPTPHPLWKLCPQMGITDVIVKVNPDLTGLADPWRYETLSSIVLRLKSAGLNVVGLEGDPFDMTPIKEYGATEDFSHKEQEMQESFSGRKERKDRKDEFRTNDNSSQITNSNVAFATGSLGVLENMASTSILQDSKTPSSESNLNPVNPVQTLADAARHFGKRIAFIHVRDVEGTKEDFTELFHDQGDTDQFALMRTYHELGLDVPVRGDHVPEMAYDRVLTPDGTPGYFTLGRLFANGYLKALLRGSE